jgi:hypothetical protein
VHGLLVLAALWSPADASATEELVRMPAKFLEDIDQSEHFASEVGGALKRTIVQGLRTLDFGRVESGLSSTFLGRPLRLVEGHAVEDRRFEVREYHATNARPVERQTWVADLKDGLRRYVALDVVRFKFFEFRLVPAAGRAHGKMHFDFAGPLAGGGRGEFHATILVEAIAQDAGSWLLDRFELERGHQVHTASPPFRDIRDSTGFHFNESRQNRELVQNFIDRRRMLTIGGLTVLDWNRDDRPDLLATRRNQMSVLFLNDGNGGFVRGALPFDGPAHSGYMFLHVDLDGDGLEELIGTQVLHYEDGKAQLGIWTRREGEWLLVRDALVFAVQGDQRGHTIQAMDSADVDGDGLLDLVLGVHSHSQSGQEDYNSFIAHDGAPNLLFLNCDDLEFRECAAERGLRGHQYTYITRFEDVDRDGDPDLFVGNDFGPNWLYENVDGQFERRDDHPLSGHTSYTMGICIEDFANQGTPSWYLSNMYSHAGNRIVPLAVDLQPDTRQSALAIGLGNQLLTPATTEGGGAVEWVERGEPLEVFECGWAWAPVFFDLENDGDQELYVVNGNTSHRDAAAPDW